MWTKIKFKEPITLGDLRKVINEDLSDFPDDIPIIMSPEIKDDIYEKYKIKAIIADEDSINFYNY